jgi:hypothetical protein
MPLPTLRVAPRAVVLGALVLATTLVLHTAPPAALAQLDPGSKCAGTYEVLEDGQVVGTIYVACWNPAGPSLPPSARYVEHWVLSSGYVYPGPINGQALTIRPAAEQRYTSEADFFARAPWGPGSRYVRVDASDGTRLPGR